MKTIVRVDPATTTEEISEIAGQEIMIDSDHQAWEAFPTPEILAELVRKFGPLTIPLADVEDQGTLVITLYNDTFVVDYTEGE